MKFEFTEYAGWNSQISQLYVESSENAGISIALTHGTAEDRFGDTPTRGWAARLFNFHVAAVRHEIPNSIVEAYAKGCMPLMGELLKRTGCPHLDSVPTGVALYWVLTAGFYAVELVAGGTIDASKSNLHIQLVDGALTNPMWEGLNDEAKQWIAEQQTYTNTSSDVVEVTVSTSSSRSPTDTVFQVPTVPKWTSFNLVAGPVLNKYSLDDPAQEQFVQACIQMLGWKNMTPTEISEAFGQGKKSLDVLEVLFGTEFDENGNVLNATEDVLDPNWVGLHQPSDPDYTGAPEEYEGPWQASGSKGGVPHTVLTYMSVGLKQENMLKKGSIAIQPEFTGVSRADHHGYRTPNLHKSRVYWSDYRVVTESPYTPDSKRIKVSWDIVKWLYKFYKNTAVLQHQALEAETTRVEENIASGTATGDPDAELPKPTEPAKKRGSSGLLLGGAIAAAAVAAAAAESEEKSESTTPSSSSKPTEVND